MSDIAQNFRNWREHPAQMVRELFHVEPDPWQEEALEAFPRNQRIAMKACKGPGKTAVLSWCAWNFLLTRPQPKVLATSISGDNLADGLWTEMALWRSKCPLLEHLFEWTKTRIFAKEHPETWWMAARTWSQSADKSQQANTLAGRHADYILFLLDESGGIPDAVMVAAEAALSSCKEGHIVQAGNPTHLSGPLYRAVAQESHLWKVIEITGDPDDPKRSNRISKKWAQEEIDRWGREHPYVLVNVFGRFPPSSFNALIGPDDIRASFNRTYRNWDLQGQPKIMGIDVARFGDDSSVIFLASRTAMLHVAQISQHRRHHRGRHRGARVEYPRGRCRVHRQFRWLWRRLDRGAHASSAKGRSASISPARRTIPTSSRTNARKCTWMP